jgi:ATP-dependent Clp protease ATP-binding subunit ClpB
MTSNIGTGEILDWGGDPEQDAEVRQQVMGLLRKVIKPEFLNRVDEIVIFHPLGRRHLHRIIEVQLGRLQAMLAERQITLELTDAAKELLASEGFDPTYGARPLKRALQNLIQNPLALKLLDGTIRDGQTVRVDVNEMGDAFTFTPVASAAAAETTAGAVNA